MNLDFLLVCYRIFDIGSDLSLYQIETLLDKVEEFKKKSWIEERRSIYVRDKPLCYSAGNCKINDQNFEIEVRLWSFGAISVVFLTKFEQIDWDQIVVQSARWESHFRVTEEAIKVAKKVVTFISRSVEESIFEDYMIFYFDSYPFGNKKGREILESYPIAQILLSENHKVLDPSVLKNLELGMIQYYDQEVTILTWNSALVVQKGERFDIPNIIELALCQVLELRYYDQILEKKLSRLYDFLQSRAASSWWSNRAEQMGIDAAKNYLEVSELVEKVGNSLKVIGDLYLAQIFVTASLRFRFTDWRENVLQKLRMLNEISTLLNGNIHARRSQLLELIIIVLIAVELIPLVKAFLR